LETFETARTISPTPLLFVSKRPVPRGTWGNFEETIEAGWGKSGMLGQKSGRPNISETRKDRRKVTTGSL